MVRRSTIATHKPPFFTRHCDPIIYLGNLGFQGQPPGLKVSTTYKAPSQSAQSSWHEVFGAGTPPLTIACRRSEIWVPKSTRLIQFGSYRVLVGRLAFAIQVSGHFSYVKACLDEAQPLGSATLEWPARSVVISRKSGCVPRRRALRRGGKRPPGFLLRSARQCVFTHSAQWMR